MSLRFKNGSRISFEREITSSLFTTLQSGKPKDRMRAMVLLSSHPKFRKPEEPAGDDAMDAVVLAMRRLRRRVRREAKHYPQISAAQVVAWIDEEISKRR